MTISAMVSNEFTLAVIEKELRKKVVLVAIRATGNKSKAAVRLGVHRNTITRILEGK